MADPGTFPAQRMPNRAADEPGPRIAVLLPPDASATEIVALARTAAEAGIRELWVAEDLGLHGGVALAGQLLASLDPQVRVGLGIAPAAARHPAFLAMQAATLAQLHPGRLLLGIGHGMPGWMRQLGLWSRTPVLRLEASLRAVRSLLAGEQVDLDQGGVLLDAVALSTAPVSVPLYAGVRGPQSLTACAPLVDGVVLAGWSGPAYTHWARDLVTAAGGGPRRIVSSARLAYDPADPGSARRRLRRALGRHLTTGTIDHQLSPVGRSLDDPDLVDAVGIAGGPENLAEGLQRWWQAGADTVLIDTLSAADLERLLSDGLPPTLVADAQ